MNLEVKQPFIKPEIQVQELTHALYETSKKLEYTNQQLLQVQKEKDEIFSNISHDLRAPITVINNAVENLLSMDQIDKDTLYKMLNVIKKRGDFVHHLVEDVFFLTSIHTNKNFLYKENIPISSFLEEYYYGIAADKGYQTRKLGYHLPTDYEYTVSMDVKLMQRVLDNLFSNALKFSSKGDIICLNAYEDNHNTITFQVIDTGIGIPRSQIPHVFQRTYMADSSRTPSENGGCGLGLAISQSIVEKHKGQIRCKSVEGKGSVFSVNLPFIEKKVLK
ncbi:MAG: HAMP domain-containing sensor histidine kinase [bacterium]|nr:HAMP domain-containing sensor histidine kinase [bacterium]